MNEVGIGSRFVSIRLHWDAEQIQRIALQHDIRNRDDLAIWLEKAGISRTTVYRAFDSSWAGKVSLSVLAALAHTFEVSVGLLVHEPTKGKAA